jgi:hypothetical protein
LRIVPQVGARVVIEIVSAAAESSQPRAEADHEPLFHVEWPEKDLLHRLESFFEWFENLNLWFGSIHATIGISS